VNDARFGYVNMDRNNKTLDQTVPASSYGIYTGVTNPIIGSLPQIHVNGFTNLGGSPGWPSLQGPASVFQFVDYVSYSLGNHAIKFGGEIRHNGVDVGAYGGSKGAIRFSGGNAFSGSTPLEDFLAGFPNTATIQLGNPQRHLTTLEYAASVQDDWRVTPRLTVNLGLRYDYTTPLRESNNLLGNFDPAVGLLQVGNQISSPYNGDHKDFGPRFGVAWDISGNGTTVLRAGASVVFDTQLPMFVFVQVGNNAQNGAAGGVISVPTGAQIVVNGVTTPGTGTIAVSSVTVPSSNLAASWQNNGPSNTIFPPASTPIQCGSGTGTDPAPCNVSGMDRNFRSPYVTNWTLGIQRAFTPDLSLDVAYVGNHGSRLPGITDINQPIPVPGSQNALPGPLSAQYPYLGFVNFLTNHYRSNYNGLQATLTQRAFHGLSFTAGYTYSHALDQGSFNISPFLPQNSTNPLADYASSDFDIRHRFTFSLTYVLPSRKSPGQLLEGWSVNSIVTVQSGQPWIANDMGNNISGTGELSDRWDFFGNPKDFTSGPNPIPYYTGATLSAFPQTCQNAASTAALQNSMFSFGCYAQGTSAMIPPGLGTFGTMGRNIFRDSGFRNMDLSVTKQTKFRERLTAQFRAEFFNILNHPNFANPYGGPSGFGLGAYADPSQPGQFGCGCATPDQAGSNPVLGSGGNRAIQLGLKLIF
jgi:outer membrane receptor protein involved in Fe transport